MLETYATDLFYMFMYMSMKNICRIENWSSAIFSAHGVT